MAHIMTQKPKDKELGRFRLRYVPPGYRLMYKNPYRTVTAFGIGAAKDLLKELALIEQQDKIDIQLGKTKIENIVPELTTKEVFDDFIKNVVPYKEYSGNTMVKYKGLIKKIVNQLGSDFLFSKLDYKIIMDTWGSKEIKNSQICNIKSINSIGSAVRKRIADGELIGKISSKPIWHPPVKKGKPNALRQTQLRAIFEHPDILNVTKDIMRLYILTGCRRTELCRPYFTWDSIDADRKVAYIYRKGRKRMHDESFKIPWLKEHQELAERIRDHYTKKFNHPLSKDFVIPITAQNVYEQIVRARKIVGFHFTVHDLRDTGATQVLRATGNIYAAKEFCGHKSVKDTESHYADWVHDDKLDTTKALVHRVGSIL